MSDAATGQRPSRDGDDTAVRGGSWLQAEVDGRPVGFWIVVGLAIAAVTLGFGAWWTFGLDRGGPMAGGMAGQQPGTQMDEMAMSPNAPRVPAVFGYYDGEPITFTHPEVSDPDIAQVLEAMMGSPVPVVEGLAEVPEHARGVVYVFTNGLVPADTPAGPLGFQPDVFDSAPGDDDYTPLREIVQVTWTDPSRSRLLTSSGQIEDAVADGSAMLERTGVVVNAPLLTWPGGER